MRKIKPVLHRARASFSRMKWSEREMKKQLNLIATRFRIATMARKAYDDGLPATEGPVWFGRQSWKTDFWRRQWEWQGAFREGQTAKAQFADSDTNPYRRTSLPFNSRLMELETAWKCGYNGDEL